METFDSRMITMRSEDGGTTSPAPPVTPPDHQHPEKPEPQPPSCMTCEGKRQLLHKIRVCVFATTEARLFMDTHPDDKAAIAFISTTRSPSTPCSKNGKIAAARCSTAAAGP